MSLDLIKDFINKVNSGVITITPEFDIYDAYNGNYVYKASNGWSIIVFIDCGEWDYIDSIKDESGNIVYDFDHRLDDYRPNQKVIKEIYGLNKDKPYFSENWVHWNTNQESKHAILNCDICNHKMYFDYKYFNSTANLMDIVDSFYILHYYCNPIYSEEKV